MASGCAATLIGLAECLSPSGSGRRARGRAEAGEGAGCGQGGGRTTSGHSISRRDRQAAGHVRPRVRLSAGVRASGWRRIPSPCPDRRAFPNAPVAGHHARPPPATNAPQVTARRRRRRVIHLAGDGIGLYDGLYESPGQPPVEARRTQAWPTRPLTYNRRIATIDVGMNPPTILRAALQSDRRRRVSIIDRATPVSERVLYIKGPVPSP